MPKDKKSAELVFDSKMWNCCYGNRNVKNNIQVQYFQSVSEKQNTSRSGVTCAKTVGCGEGFENAPMWAGADAGS